MNASHAELFTFMESTKDKSEYIRMRAVYLFKVEKMSAVDAAKSVGTTKPTIYQWSHRFHKFGIEGLKSKPRGGRRSSFMSLEEERQLLEQITPQAKKGLVIISKIVRNEGEKQLGHPVSADWAEDLLNRHGWRKVAPRPKHPKSSAEEQEEFKKKSQNSSKKQKVHLTYKIVDL